ncbi:MAG: hypothetical protein DYG98_04210 [Haliscomenobacteraceae bacterium CHB4]|nr:hypothetical protein [Haliscomenobacteraceae bacterium CHB4]
MTKSTATILSTVGHPFVLLPVVLSLLPVRQLPFDNREYDLLVSNEILTEYLEKCIEKYGLDASEEKLDFLVDFPNVSAYGADGHK